MECFVCLFACLFLRDWPVAPHLLEFENTQTSIPQLYNKIPDRLKYVVRMGLFTHEKKGPLYVQTKNRAMVAVLLHFADRQHSLIGDSGLTLNAGVKPRQDH